MDTTVILNTNLRQWYIYRDTEFYSGKYLLKLDFTDIKVQVDQTKLVF